MKKVMLVLSAVALVACSTSCVKKCTCKTYRDGNVESTMEQPLVKGTGMKCADYSAMVSESPKNGVECK